MENKVLISKHEFVIRWVDLDAYNHLNNAKYYDFMTEARSQDLWEFKDSCGFIVTENSCKYKFPVNYPATIIVEQYVHSISASSFELFYSFYQKGNEKCFAEGTAKMVCFDLSKNRPVRIPEGLKTFFAQLQK